MTTDWQQAGRRDVLAAAERLRDLASWTPAFALRAASALGIADHLAAGPLPVGELAAATGTDEAALRRVLRALAAAGVLDDAGGDRFGLAPPGELLRSDHEFSMRDAYGLSPLECRAWAHLEHSLRTGEAAFAHAFGVSHRTYRAAHPREDARMDRAHRAATRVQVLTLLRVYDWSALGTVVDVGGGTGALLAALLGRYRHLRGVLFDLPRMVAGAGEVLEAAGVRDRCEVVGGDFFEAVPPGGDCYVLKSVVGGWGDADATAILTTVRAAMRPGSRLLVVEPVLGYGAEYSVASTVHLASLVLYGGPDRTREDYEALLRAAGLRLERLITRATLPIVEAVPA